MKTSFWARVRVARAVRRVKEGFILVVGGFGAELKSMLRDGVDVLTEALSSRWCQAGG